MRHFPFPSVRAAALGLIAALALAAPLPPAVAQELAPDHLALARRYIDATDRAAIYEVTVVQMGIDVLQTLGPQNPNLVDEITAAIGVVVQSYRDDKDTLLNQFARIYALRFSAEEMEEIVDFYESPTGQRLAASNAAINSDLQRVLGVFTNNLRREFLAAVRAELRAQDINL